MRAGVYIRVSTEDQEAENQLPSLLALCAARGWEVDVREEVASGKKARPVLDALCADAHRGKVGAVVVWKLDRLGRNKLEAAVRIGRLLAIPKLSLVSYQETWIEQPSAVRSLMVDIFTWQAEDEHRNIVERTKLALAKRKAKGLPMGRPRADGKALAAALAEVGQVSLLTGKPEGLRAIAARHGLSAATLSRARQGTRTPKG